MEYTEKLELLNEMKRRWPNQINEEIQSIKISQNSQVALIEITLQNLIGSISVEETNLDFIVGENPDELLFKPYADVVDNAKEFVRLDGFSLVNCIDNLFTKEAEQEISNKHLESVKVKIKA
jgi:hypothetical protein